MKRRKPKQPRRTNPRILILCDGLTEKKYFLALKQDPENKRVLAALSVDIAEAKKREPIQIVEEAIKRKRKARQENNEYNHIWVVYDHDNRPKLFEAYKQAEKNNIQTAFSSIAIEHWYLVHFLKTAKPFTTCEALIKELKKYFPEYQKTKQNDYILLKDKLDTVFKNADWLKKQMQGHIEEGKHITELNPYTDVDVLVRFLLAFSKNK